MPGGQDNLVAKARRGDLEAFAECFEAFRPLLHRLAYRLVGGNDCDDVVMETYLKAWRSLPGFRGEAGLKTWVCRILRSCALDQLRRRQRQEGRQVSFETTEVEDGEPLKDRLADLRTPAPDRQAGLGELERHLAAALEQLSEPHRLTLLLREVDGLSYHEVAVATGANLGTVMSRLFYAKRLMRRHLAAMGVAP